MSVHKTTRTLLYGESGAGKTTAAVTWPGPKLVLSFDPYDKMTPHRDEGIVEQVPNDPFLTELGLQDWIVVERVKGKDGKLLSRIEYYPETDPQSPTAWLAYQARALHLKAAAQDFSTIIVDSLTYMEAAFMRYGEFVLMKEDKQEDGYYKDQRVLYGHLKRRMVNELMARLPWLPCNVVLVAHTSEDKSEFEVGEVIRGISVVGDLKKKLSAGYGECYRAYVEKDAQGQRKHLLQTKKDSRWIAASQIGAPNPCEPRYEALWKRNS